MCIETERKKERKEGRKEGTAFAASVPSLGTHRGDGPRLCFGCHLSLGSF